MGKQLLICMLAVKEEDRMTREEKIEEDILDSAIVRVSRDVEAASTSILMQRRY